MNSVLTKKALKINGLFATYSAQKTTSVSLLAAMFLSVFSASALANRPAMDDRIDDTAAQSEMQTEPTAIEPRPAAEGPSAVELMMQQQSGKVQQSGTVLTLPAKEMQPGETLMIQLLDYPRRGMNMDRVQQEFGQPIATSDSVGQPPITHWTYRDRVVYFEYSTVLHVVAR